MKTENTRAKILISCIAFAILGTALIYAVNHNADIKRVNISGINNKIAGENIITCGIIKSKSVSQSGTTFITLENGSKVRVVFFKNEMQKAQNLSRGESICVKGNVQIYNGSAEIIGRKIIADKA